MTQPAPIIPLAAKQARLGRLTNGREPLTVVGTTASGSPGLTALGSMAGVAVGAVAVGAGIPAATTVLAVDDVAHTATLSANATATHAAENIVFTNPAFPGPLKFRLGKANTPIADDIVLATLVAQEATFDGYPAGGWTLSFTPGYITSENVPSNESQMIASIMATAGVTNLIWNWWIDDGVTVWMASPFATDVGIPMNRVGAALKLMVEDSYPPGLPLAVILPAA